VPALVIFTGLACGTLLTAAGLALWDGFRQVPGLSRAIQVIRWLAGATLLVGAVLAWQRGPSLFALALSGVEGPILRLMLMAALAALPGIHRRRASPWGGLMLILPALVLAAAGLVCSPAPVETRAGRLPVELALVLSAGLGARALGQALSEIVAPPSPPSPLIGGTEGGLSPAATYALLTLLMTATALVNLWQRGTLWGGSSGESELAGAWLAWSAVWLGPRQRPRLRAALTVVAALLLIVLVAG